MARLLWAVVLGGLMALPLPAVACRQALALGLDVSGSVDAVEYQLQLDGLAAALKDPAVVSAILSAPETPIFWRCSNGRRLHTKGSSLAGPNFLRARRWIG